MDKFTEIKEEILCRAKESKACVEQYKRALESQTLAELAQVIKDNFTWCCNNKVLDVEIIEKYKSEFATVEIYANESISSGYVVIDGEVEKLSGSAVAKMCGNATVTKMCDNSTVTDMCGNATVTKMCGNSTVTKMWDNSTVTKMLDNSTVTKMCGNATVTKMCDNSTVTKMCGNSTVTEMWDNSYISTYIYIECKINDNAIMRVRSENKIYTNTTVEKPKL